MKPFLQVVAICTLTGLLSGCIVGRAHYSKEGDRWAYVSWNEGVGRQAEFVEGADEATFTKIDEEHAKDKHSVYWHCLPIPKADPGSFRHLVGGYWRDDHSVFLGTEVVDGADPEHFCPLAIDPWATDGKNIFYHNSRMPVRDVASFVLLNEDLAKDSATYYSPCVKGDIVDCDYASFRLLNARYAKDRNKVFYQGNVIVGADIDSFAALNEFTAQDRYRRYRGSEEFWEDRAAKKKRPPNKTPEPTTPSVTPAADAPVAPAGVAAHL